ncbi:GAF domain-containing protein [bacterium]|nr:GAF domain-containing protein [bacterium]
MKVIGGSAMQRWLPEMAATSELLADATSLGEVLAHLAARAREVTASEYAAISTFDERGVLERFIYNGIDEEMAQRLGHPPVGRGLLGELVHATGPVRIDDLATHPSFTGWPEGHPDMAIFLGVPIRAGGHTIGSLYMTRERGKPVFTADDEMAGSILALQAAVALSAALARERSGRLVLLEERERIARDLHDGAIQTLYALGLRFDAARVVASNPDVRTTLDESVENINQLIADLRQYITMLEAETPDNEPDLARDLPFVVQQAVPPGVDTIVNITAAALHELTARDAEDLLYFTREALSNAVRHGQPTKVAVDLRQTIVETALTIQDDGAGFDQTHARQGFGTVTMKSRAERLGASFILVGIPGMGTTVRLTIPRGEPHE